MSVEQPCERSCEQLRVERSPAAVRSNASGLKRFVCSALLRLRSLKLQQRTRREPDQSQNSRPQALAAVTLTCTNRPSCVSRAVDCPAQIDLHDTTLAVCHHLASPSFLLSLRLQPSRTQSTSCRCRCALLPCGALPSPSESSRLSAKSEGEKLRAAPTSEEDAREETTAAEEAEDEGERAEVDAADEEEGEGEAEERLKNERKEDVRAEPNEEADGAEGDAGEVAAKAAEADTAGTSASAARDEAEAPSRKPTPFVDAEGLGP